MTLAQSFQRNFSRIRTEKKLSQEALARRARVSVSYVSMLQRGIRTPPLATVEVLATALQVRPHDLLKAA